MFAQLPRRSTVGISGCRTFSSLRWPVGDWIQEIPLPVRRRDLRGRRRIPLGRPPWRRHHRPRRRGHWSRAGVLARRDAGRPPGDGWGRLGRPTGSTSGSPFSRASGGPPQKSMPLRSRVKQSASHAGSVATPVLRSVSQPQGRHSAICSDRVGIFGLVEPCERSEGRELRLVGRSRLLPGCPRCSPVGGRECASSQ